MKKEEYINLKSEICDWDIEVYKELVSTKLTPEQERIITEPGLMFPKQREVLAVHWHPEMVEFPLIRKRIDTMFPDKEEELLIPTQHNQLMSFGDYCGVEIDCFSPEFNRKVQLLVHFTNDKKEKTGVLESMLDHTFKYRSSQFFRLMDAVIEEKYSSYIDEALKKTWVDENIIELCKIYTQKLINLVDKFYSETPQISIKNKLLPNYMIKLKEFYPEKDINQALMFLKSVKKVVKKHFDLSFFYLTHEIIEEVRNVGGGVVIPHPEQFWPVLLADYDIDGIEVWNPQSQEFTKFLCDVVIRKNKEQTQRSNPILIFMGDDTHLGEKIKPASDRNPEKAGREIGYQPAWEDVDIKKSLIRGDADRLSTIREYKARLENY